MHLHLNFAIALAGAIVGFLVGVSGMGGGSLMTPILVLFFRTQPFAAISSDLVASMVMKPVGGLIHFRRGTVNWEAVAWLALGSVPAAFAGVLLLRVIGGTPAQQGQIKSLIGAALLLSGLAMLAKGLLELRRRRALDRAGQVVVMEPFRVKRVRTVLIGMAGGLAVGMTSVGSGSLIFAALALLYPSLAASRLVGTDLVQAVPLVTSAAIGHLLFGHFQLPITASILAGSLPGVYLGARLSSRAPGIVIRPVLIVVLLASALKLLKVPNLELAVILLAVVAMGLPFWILAVRIRSRMNARQAAELAPIPDPLTSSAG